MKLSKAQASMLMAGILGVIASILLLCAPCIKETVTVSGISVSHTYSGMDLLSGKDTGFKFNFMVFLTALFGVVMLGGAIRAMLKQRGVIVVSLIAAALMTIFCFCMVQFFPMGIEGGKKTVEAAELLGAKYSLGGGAIGGGICGAIATVNCIAALVIKE